MKKSRIIAAALALVSLSAFSACGEKDKGHAPVESSIPTYEVETEPITNPPTEPVSAAADGPRLYIKDTTVAPGGIAEVRMAVENAEQKWNICGIHVTYDNRLECQMLDEEKGFIKYKKGDASEYATGAVGMIWKDGLPKELIADNMGCVFFTEVFDGDFGLDGDIVTFYFKVPDDAEPGTEYPIGFYYRDTDLFSNSAKDKSMDMYVFENWKGGKVVVE